MYERLKDAYEVCADKSIRWHYRINGREVCMDVFAACHCVGNSTIYTLHANVIGWASTLLGGFPRRR